MTTIPEIILASSSPYRRELLKRLQIDFTAVTPDVDEDQFKSKIPDPLELAKTLAYEKSKVVSEQFPNAVVIGSDQLVSFEGMILGKPGSKAKAIDQLAQLSGKSHLLITACSVCSKGQTSLFVDQTEMFMRDLSKQEIESNIEKDNPLDCAGSYKIESLGISLFSQIITNDFTAITGLPLIKLSEALRKFGCLVP